MRLIILFFISICYGSITLSQSINLPDFSPVCDVSPNVEVVDRASELEMSGMTICGSNSTLVLTIQENGVIRYFDMWKYIDEAPIVGTVTLGAEKDYEGITYLFEEFGSHYYAACNEDDSKVAVFSINDVNDNLSLDLNINNGQTFYVPVVDLNGNVIPTGGNSGLEGITYNPDNGKIYVVKEKGPPTLYESQNSFSSISDILSVSEITVRNISTSSFDNNIDFSGLFHLNLSEAVIGQNSTLLVSQETNTVYLLNIANQSASLVESYALTGVNSDAKIEGVIYNRRTLLVCNDDDQGRRNIYSDFYSYIYKGPNGILGDANCDGVFDIGDVDDVIDFAIGLTSSICDNFAADADFDGNVTINDARFLNFCVTQLGGPICPCKN